MSVSQVGAATRAQQGWDRLVQQLNEVDDPRKFLQGVLELQCKVVAAEYGAMFAPNQEGKAELLMAWPNHVAQAGPDSPVIKLLAQGANGGIEKGASQVLQIQPTEQGGTGDSMSAYVFVTPLKQDGKVAAVCAVAAEVRDPQVLQATAPMRELAAGLYAGFVARRQAAEAAKEVERVRKALAVVGVVQEGEGFHGAGMQLVNELARQLKCTRVSLGWIKGKGVELKAMSDTEDLKRHSEQVNLLELAMSECLDQQQPVVYPLPKDAEPLLAQAVLHSHRRLTGEHPNRHVVTLPLRDGDEWVGALTLERMEQPFNQDVIQELQLLVDTVAPHLNDRKKSSRFLVQHAWASVEWASAYLVGPKHIAWKLGGVAVMILLLIIFFGSFPYKVTSDFVLQAEQRRILPAPFQGQIHRVHHQPGDVVPAGTVLAELDTTDLRLQRAEARSEYRQAHVQWTQAKGKQEESKAQEALATMEKAQARVQLLDYKIEHAVIKAPIDGVVLSGHWLDKVGGVVERGEQMFEVAPLDNMVAVIKVDESDLDLVKHALSNAEQQGLPGAHGRLATRARPETKFDFDVVRIVPMAEPVEGKNVFELRADVTIPPEQQDWLRPGMEGLARTDVGTQPIYWILTRRLTDYVRLWVWW